MSQPVTKLKFPYCITANSKAKKNNEEPGAKSPLSTLAAEYKNKVFHESIFKVQETPNLEAIKQKCARQTHGSAKKKINKLNNQLFQQSIDKFEQTDSSTEMLTFENQYFCQNHPNKRAKYFLQGNPLIAMCTKCALSLGDSQPLLDQQKMYKTLEISKFMSMATVIKDAILERQEDKEVKISSLKNQYMIAIESINAEFQNLSQSIQEKRQCLVEQMQRKYHDVLKNMEKSSYRLEDIFSAVERYIKDINLNYQQIVHNLNKDHFNQIMQQYHFKIKGHLDKIGECSVDQLKLNFTKINTESVISAIMKIDFKKSNLKQNQRRDNYGSLNLKNGKKPKTPNKFSV